MTKKEYEIYQQKVVDFFEVENIKIMSMDDSLDVPFFSWEPCECCKSPLGGDRYTMRVVLKIGDSKGITYNICPDCLYYNEYGQLDDQTMMEIEDDEKQLKDRSFRDSDGDDTWGTEPVRFRT